MEQPSCSSIRNSSDSHLGIYKVDSSLDCTDVIRSAKLLSSTDCICNQRRIHCDSIGVNAFHLPVIPIYTALQKVRGLVDRSISHGRKQSKNNLILMGSQGENRFGNGPRSQPQNEDLLLKCCILVRNSKNNITGSNTSLSIFTRAVKKSSSSGKKSKGVFLSLKMSGSISSSALCLYPV